MIRKRLILLSLIAFLIACQDNNEIVIPQKLPIREIYLKLETGVQLGVKTFTYNQSGNLLRELYQDARFQEANYEIRNEYDANERKTKLIHTFSDPTNFNTVEYTYEKGKVKTETLYYQEAYPHYRIKYFYNNHEQSDSSHHFYHQSLNNIGFTYNFTTHYRYIDGRLIKEWRKGTNVDFISKLNRYEGDRLIETCNPVTNMELVENCIRNNYTTRGQLYRVYSTYTGTPEKLLEQYTYKDNMLTKKLIFDQSDYLPAYNPDPARYTILVRYEYE